MTRAGTATFSGNDRRRVSAIPWQAMVELTRIWLCPNVSLGYSKKQMPHSSKAVANEFVAVANENGAALTPMKLLKLIYFAHGWHLALAGAPLVDERVEAWKFGPVVPSVYHAFKRFGMNPITAHATALDLSEWREKRKVCFFVPRLADDDTIKSLLRRIWTVYGKRSAIELSNLTHQPGTPWSIVWERGGKDIKGTDIPDPLIKEHFAKKLAKQHAG